MTGILIIGLAILLRHLPQPNDKWSWVPFVGAIGIFILGFHGLAYSFYPYIVPNKLTIWAAASAPESVDGNFYRRDGGIALYPWLRSIFAYRIFLGESARLKILLGIFI